MYIRVKFYDDDRQSRLILVDDIGRTNKGIMILSIAETDGECTFESQNIVSDTTYNDLLDFALIHGYVDMTTVGIFDFSDENDSEDEEEDEENYIFGR